jgi:glucose/arabinose dehydrogenase
VLAALASAFAIAGCGGGSGSADEAAPQIPLADEASGFTTSAQGVHLVRIGTFAAPTYLTSPPGDRRRLFVVEQRGTIAVVRDRRVLHRPFVDLRGDVLAGGERGLLSMAFAPDYALSRRVYVYYTGHDGDIHIQEFRASRGDPNVVDRSTRRELLRLDHSEFPNHNGGQLQFGPGGFLYAGVGDGGSGGDPHNNAQNLSRPYGKILRLRPTGAPRPEVYAYGLRNPWRFMFDRMTGDMVIADVGQDEVEEVDFAPRGKTKGRNYGWRAFEGRRRYHNGPAPNAVPPVIEKTHASGWCSITGGYVVRDRSLRSLYGRYVYGDFCKPELRSARLRTGRAMGDRPLGLRVQSLSSFGEDARGRVYALSLRGPVFRLAP